MSRYVQHVLQPEETVTYESKIHWLIYLPTFFFVLVLVAGVVLYLHQLPEIFISYGLMAIGAFFGAAAFLRAWFTRWTTEIAVTNRRIIYKRGFISRSTIEMNMDKVESIDVRQTILGRIFDYGDIFVRGTGSSLEPLRMIEAPIAFRNAVIAR